MKLIPHFQMVPARFCHQGFILHEAVGEGALFPFESCGSPHNISAEMNVVLDSRNEMEETELFSSGDCDRKKDEMANERGLRKWKMWERKERKDWVERNKEIEAKANPPKHIETGH